MRWNAIASTLHVPVMAQAQLPPTGQSNLAAAVSPSSRNEEMSRAGRSRFLYVGYQ